MAKLTAQRMYALMSGGDLEPRAYSGRGMYGKQCVGCATVAQGASISVLQTIAQLLRGIDEEEIDLFADALDGGQ